MFEKKISFSGTWTDYTIVGENDKVILPEKAECRETSVESLSPAVIDTPLQQRGRAHTSQTNDSARKSDLGTHRDAATAAISAVIDTPLQEPVGFFYPNRERIFFLRR
jgi:hypothetical protein